MPLNKTLTEFLESKPVYNHTVKVNETTFNETTKNFTGPPPTNQASQGNYTQTNETNSTNETRHEDKHHRHHKPKKVSNETFSLPDNNTEKKKDL